ncbi:TrbG/VirB9 family P-type conjugative transfer protein [Novosphingobium sp. 9U]|uniref:TrbG/VirB9 family P-type conjugative transfer protein n=1 Tax=Novosphingobium sp. 9U TaxID=2653158 RepID=UPI0012F11508|nr:TrbG/VirB9 family P-type conjugative transfer protein [Novosphingobium sp. 9U]VWX54782.1 Forms the bulk of type IV secretion complex that spans outer membrane and periplasm (VirB9) [Novosphingobium sp. 9U]
MIRGLLLAATGLVALAQPALAADDRLIQHMYAENEVVRIDGRPGVQATITFGEGEAIENVAVGDSAAWQITPNKRADVLFVKPLEGGARTNMTVVTDRHTYFFDLVASPKAKPVYLLRFTYRDAPKKGAPAGPALASLTSAEQAVLTGEPAEAGVDPAALNFAFRTKGDARILPSRMYDDGNATYLLWGEKSEVPAILVQNEKGEVGPVNYSVRGRTIVVEDVPRMILLRSGKSQATIENQRPAAVATPAVQNAGTAPPAAPAPTMAPASVVAAASTTASPVRDN